MIFLHAHDPLADAQVAQQQLGVPLARAAQAQLDRHVPVQRLVPRQIHHPHAAGPEHPLDHEAPLRVHLHAFVVHIPEDAAIEGGRLALHATKVGPGRRRRL